MHVPPDQRSPHGRAAAAKRGNPPAESANPHQRQSDRASGDDDSEAERLKAERLEAERAARRSRLVQSGFPIFCRYDDLVAAGIVANRTTLLRLIDDENFPPGVMIGPNTRAWRFDEVEAWLERRPSARKAVPPGAVHPRVRDKRRAAKQEMTT
jgi:predicted DNA-binding transcriptional regulator AlpA